MSAHPMVLLFSVSAVGGWLAFHLSVLFVEWFHGSLAKLRIRRMDAETLLNSMKIRRGL